MVDVDDSVMYDDVDGSMDGVDRSPLDIRRITDSGCRRKVENVLAKD